MNSVENKNKIKNGGNGTFVGNALRWIVSNGKTIAPEILNVASAVTGIDGLNKLGDLIRGDDSIPQSDKDIGGVSNSQHILGKASDIVIEGFTPNEVANTIDNMLRNEYNPNLNIGGLGRYNTFTHIDIRDYMARWDNRK